MKWNAVKKIPLRRRYVLLQFERKKNLPPTIVVGYWKDGLYISPGFERDDREPIYWCDCLGDGFRAPGWYGPQVPSDSIQATIEESTNRRYSQ